MSAFPSAEKRHLRRAAGNTLGAVAWQLDPDSSIRKAQVQDFTVQGMAMVTDRAATLGKRITIHMLHRFKTVTLDAEVRHARPIENGCWLLGCRLARLLSVDDVLDI